MLSMRPTRLFVIILVVAYLAVQAGAEILLEQLPGQNPGGAASDTSYIHDFGFPSYQQVADDFRFSETKVITGIRWWGFYGGVFSGSTHPPVDDETMRIRVYADDGSEGLPGSVLFEEAALNPSRVLTGNFAGGGQGAREYQYDVQLSTPFTVQPNVGHWLEIVQSGDINSLYRREYGWGEAAPLAIRNSIVGDVWSYTDFYSNLSVQLLGIPEPSSAILFISLGTGCLLTRKIYHVTSRRHS